MSNICGPQMPFSPAIFCPSAALSPRASEGVAAREVEGAGCVCIAGPVQMNSTPNSALLGDRTPIQISLNLLPLIQT